MIPAVAHFIWFGARFPCMHAVAVRSALARGGFDEVVLHHADDLSPSPYFAELAALPGFRAERLDPHQLLAAVPAIGPRLEALFQRLRKPAAQANVIRAALLYLRGGVYLDMDTVTVAPVTDLRASASLFCGTEPIVWPGAERGSRAPGRLALAAAREVARFGCVVLPRGWRGFRRIEGLYPAELNNAVLAAEPGHPVLRALLERALAMPPEQQLVRYALGTHLLQAVIAEAELEGVRVLPPPYFYPLGPELSRHWFRTGTAPYVPELLRPETRVVHWYASVRTEQLVPRLTPETIAAWAEDRAICALALPFVTQPAGART